MVQAEVDCIVELKIGDKSSSNRGRGTKDGEGNGKGWFPISVFAYIPVSGDVEIGALATANIEHQWSNWDNFTLSYLGSANPMQEFLDNASAASEDNPIDATSAIINPEAEYNASNWMCPNSIGILGSEGSRFFEPAGWWKSSASMSQTVTNLPNGYYALNMKYQASEHVKVTLTGNTSSYNVQGTNEGWKDMVVTCLVSNNSLNITASSEVTDDETRLTWFNADNFTLTYYGNDEPTVLEANMKLTAGKYGTFIAPFDVKLPAGVVAYTCQMTKGDATVSLDQVAPDGVLPACTPVVIYQSKGENVNETFRGVDARDDKTAVIGTSENNDLVGFYVSGELIPSNGSAYVLQTQNDKQAFYRVNSTFHGTANRCYLVPKTSTQANVIRFDGDEEIETAIENILNNEQTTVIYDLSGRRVNNTAKGGIYIINGKKVIK